MIFCVAHKKGGCGKTTLATNLAVVVTKAGKECLLVDTDPQASSMSFVAARESHEPPVPRIFATQFAKPGLHHQMPELMGDRFSVGIIDTAGRDNGTFRSSVAAADHVIIPVSPSVYDIWATDEVLQLFKAIFKITAVPVTIVWNQKIEGTRIAREANAAMDELRSKVPDLDLRAASTAIHHRVAFKQSAGVGLGVIEFEPRGKAAGEITALANELDLTKARDLS